MSNVFKVIKKRMMDRITQDASKLEGSFVADNIQAVATELARIYAEDIDTILDKSFVATAKGEWLDKVCSDYGITRNPATFAEVMVEIEGNKGGYDAIRIMADDITFVTDKFIITDTMARVRALSQTIGSVGNVLANTVIKIMDNKTNLHKATNPTQATGGFDSESDESLSMRTLERIRTPSTSGNIADYKKWTLEISGVDKVKVFPLARGNGTVDVVVIADNNMVAPDILLAEIGSYIEDMRPIGADVLVSSATPVTIKITAQVVLLDGYDVETVTTQLQQLLSAYVKEIAFSYQLISYVKMADLLFSCEGVVDVTNYQLNGDTKSIVLQEREFPMALLPEITV